jgi:hypothetical protein
MGWEVGRGPLLHHISIFYDLAKELTSACFRSEVSWCDLCVPAQCDNETEEVRLCKRNVPGVSGVLQARHIYCERKAPDPQIDVRPQSK